MSLRTKTSGDKLAVRQRIRVAIQVIKQSAKPTHNKLDRHAHATTTAGLVVDCAMLTMTRLWNKGKGREEIFIVHFCDDYDCAGNGDAFAYVKYFPK